MSSPISAIRLPASQQVRPQRVPPSTTALRSFPQRDGSLKRTDLDNRRDPYLEAALENRRRNGLPIGSNGEGNQILRETQALSKEHGQLRTEEEEGQLSDSYAAEVGTWEEERIRTAEVARPPPQRESLTPLGKGKTTVTRMTSTRRYMDQLDEDDFEAMDHIEEEEGEQTNDRGTWHSGWGSEARDSVASLGVRLRNTKGNVEASRESNMSAMTFKSQSSDTFHYSMYESMQPHTDHSFQSDSQPLPPPVPSTSRLPSEPLSILPSGVPAFPSGPIVRIGPPSPTTDSFLNDPQQTREWDNLPSSPPSPISPGRQSVQPSSPPPPSSTQNRARSQTVSKNFSRPFVATSNPPLPTSSSLDLAQSSSPSVPYPLTQQRRPTTPRTDSLESASSPNPLDRKSSLGAGSSSLDHSGSSVGGHSMSASWEGRKMYGMRQHEEARRAITIAREQSQRGRLERDQGNADVEELKGDVSSRQRYASEEGAYGGEDEGEEESIHFPGSSQYPVSTEEESPYLAYAAPSPPTSSQPFPPDSAKSTFFEDFSTSAHSHASHPASFTADPRPAPAPPTSFQPSVSLPLPIPGSAAPSMHRRPSDSPSFRSQHSTSPYPPKELNVLSFSAPASSSSPPSKQRNVLRKARPSRREEDAGSSAPMSRSGSALSSHSQTCPTGEPAGPWARFRSRSKSRNRATAATTSTFFDDPPPSPLPPTPQDSYFPQKPPLRHLTSSASLQPPRTEPLASPAFPSPSSTSPLSQADFARLQASRPAFLRAKTSTSNLEGSKEWKLKEVSGQKSVQTGLVHSGEAASVYGDGEEMERLQDRVGNVGLGASPGGFGMNRSVSDQGPSTRPFQHQQSHDRTPSNGGNSLYSDYSIYSLPPSPLNTSPTTPMAPARFEPPSPEVSNGGLSRHSTLQKAKQTLGNGPARGRMMRTPSGNERRADPVTPDDFLQVGIDHHEAGELERAAWCFEQSAKKDGGCGAGMLMYGLTLRHGWGCQLNAPLGFRYLQMAAESVVEDLDRVVFGGRTLTESEANTKAAKSELVLALHEIGVSYRFGWGVEKNKKMAVSYFILSADLGDMDAQQDVAFCFANGKGVKKDLKKAAHYYRLAVKQGGEDWGLSWIYKPKYMDT